MGKHLDNPLRFHFYGPMASAEIALITGQELGDSVFDTTQNRILVWNGLAWAFDGYYGVFDNDTEANTYITSNFGAPAFVPTILYRNNTTGKIRMYNGSSWDEIGTGGGAVNLDVNENFTGPGATFTVLNNYVPGTTQVHLNGLRQELGVDYTEGPAANQITFSTPTVIGDIVVIDYQT